MLIKKIYHQEYFITIVFYSFELQLAGVILLSAMTAGGISLWLKRRREKINQVDETKTEEQNI